MKRFAAVIISIVFIFTACSRHAVENKVFQPAERKQSQKQQKGIGYIAIYIAAFYILHEDESEIKIIQDIYTTILGTPEEILGKIRLVPGEPRAEDGDGIINLSINFNLKTNPVILTGNKGYEFRAQQDLDNNIQLIIYNKNNRKDYPFLTVTPERDEIPTSVSKGTCVPLIEGIKLKQICNFRTLKITSDNQANTDFLEGLISLVPEDHPYDPGYSAGAAAACVIVTAAIITVIWKCYYKYLIS